MIEVEIKVKIPDPELIRKKFKEIKVSYKFSLIHEDTYYNMPIGLRDFKNTDEALRVRKSIRYHKNNSHRNKEIKYFFTYKGRKIDPLTKTRNEIEILIDNKKNLKKIFEILGFREVLNVKKERELYETNFKDYTIEILIDFLPILKQHFLEVEYLAKTSEEVNNSQKILFEFLNQLGIKKEHSIRKSYLELILEEKIKKI